MSTYYVSTTGSDSTGDGTLGNPWLTVTHANSNSINGDTIYLLAGTYSAIHLPYSTSIDGKILTSASYQSCIIDYISTPFGSSTIYGIILGNGNIKNLTIKNVIPVDTGIKLLLPKTPGTIGIIENCRFDNIYGSGEYCPSLLCGTYNDRLGGTQIFRSNIFTNLKQSETYAYGVFYVGGDNDHTELYNNLIYLEDVGSFLTPNLISYGSPWNSYNNSSIIGRNNIFINNTGSTINYATQGGISAVGVTIDMQNNCFQNITGSPVINGNINSDPLLIDPDNGNFGLRPNSPCIGTGVLI